MSDSAFIFKKWETRVPYYALMKLEEEKICTLESVWGAAISKSIGVALATTFGGGWSSVMKEAGKQFLKYGGRKALGCITGGSLWVFWFVIYCTNHKISKNN